MPRIRTIKPEFPQSESMGKVSRDARLTFILLWTLADDSGRLRGNSRMLASLLYPYDDDARRSIDRWLDELVTVGSIIRYEIDGDSFIAIAKWLSHQKIDKPSKSRIPPPIEGSDDPREHSPNPREDSLLDQGSKDQGSKDQGREPRVKLAKPDGVSDRVWQDFLAHRKAKKAPVTETAIAGIQREAVKAGWTMEGALTEIVSRGWQGFKADWVAEGQQQGFGRTVAPAAHDPESRSAIEARGVEMGLGKWDEREHWHAYKARVVGKQAPAVHPSIASMVVKGLAQ